MFIKSSVSIAKLDDEATTSSAVRNPRDTVGGVLAGLRSFGLRRFVSGDYFQTVVLTLSGPQVDQIIDALRVERPDFAVDFFHILSEEYGFLHSRVSRFIASHVLAGKRRFKEMQLVIKQTVEEEDVL